MITLRTLNVDDVKEAITLSRHASWNQVENDWHTMLKMSPNGSVAAIKDGRIVGTVSTISYKGGFSFIAMVLVHPDHRKQGIGKILLDKAMELLKNEKTIKLDATPQGKGLYIKSGFVAECDMTRLVHMGTDFRYKKNTAAFIRENEIDEIIKADAQAFDGERSILIKNMIHQYPSHGFCIKESGTIKGYCLGRKGYYMNQLGPVIAETEIIARQLVAIFIKYNKGCPVFIDVFDDNIEWKKWLVENEFIEQRKFTRMVFGEDNYRGDKQKQFAITGPEFG